MCRLQDKRVHVAVALGRVPGLAAPRLTFSAGPVC